MKVELKDEQVVLDDFFKVVAGRLRFEKFDGEMSPEVRRLCLERGEAVAVVLFNRSNHSLILIEQFRYPVYRAQQYRNGWLYELVAGVVESGETPEEVVRREVLEEAGYQVENIEFLTRVYPTPGGTSERISIYYAEVAQKKSDGGGLAIEHEDIRVLELPAARVYKMIEQGEINDAKTLIGLLLVKDRVNA
ncbi:MAG: NUDIX hydrolase [candidate division KSB1 bacterium]|nr:NUDIX hydrolase [candidate division KSB1 bacterium]